MNRMNWWAILAVAALLGGIVAAVAGVSVQVMLAILIGAVVTSAFSARE